MGLKWVDTLDIALDLIETHPDVDPLTLHFPELYRWVTELQGFDDDPKHCNERILEAIQQAWIDEQE